MREPMVVRLGVPDARQGELQDLIERARGGGDLAGLPGAELMRRTGAFVLGDELHVLFGKRWLVFALADGSLIRRIGRAASPGDLERVVVRPVVAVDAHTVLLAHCGYVDGAEEAALTLLDARDGTERPVQGPRVPVADLDVALATGVPTVFVLADKTAAASGLDAFVDVEGGWVLDADLGVVEPSRRERRGTRAPVAFLSAAPRWASFHHKVHWSVASDEVHGKVFVRGGEAPAPIQFERPPHVGGEVSDLLLYGRGGKLGVLCVDAGDGTEVVVRYF